MIIAHGRHGVSIYDLTKKRLVNQFRLLREQIPLESMAMDVTVQGHYAYIVMDNFSLVRQNIPVKTGAAIKTSRLLWSEVN